MIHSIRWLGPLVFTAAVLVSAGAGAQGAPGVPGADTQAPPPDSTAASEGDKAAENAGSENAKADDFDRTPTSCIPLSNIKQTVIIDDSTILFYMRGGKKVTYRTSLPHECPNLAREDRFRYTTAMNRLCDSDLITVLEQFGVGLRDGFSCRLGSFYPIPYEEAELLRKEHDKPGSTRGAVKTKPADIAPKSDAPPAASEPTPKNEQAPASEQAPAGEQTGAAAPR